MEVFRTGPEFQILAAKNVILKVAEFGQTCSNLHLLRVRVYGDKFRIMVYFPDSDP